MRARVRVCASLSEIRVLLPINYSKWILESVLLFGVNYNLNFNERDRKLKFPSSRKICDSRANYIEIRKSETVELCDVSYSLYRDFSK